MSNILQSLGVSANQPAPEPEAAPAPEGAAPANGQGKLDTSALENFPVLKDLVEGKFPGVNIPKGLPMKPIPGMGPEVLSGLGLGIYKPHEAGVQATVFNPRLIALDKVKEADKAGTLKKLFPPITQYLSAPGPRQAAPGSALPQDGPAAPPSPATGSALPQDGPAAPAPDASAPPTPVPVLPRPTFGAGAQAKATQARMQSPANVPPTQRPIPGGGMVLNGLLPKTF